MFIEYRCHIVVPMIQQPLMLLRNPSHIASLICFDAYSSNQFNMFSDNEEALIFVKKRQALESSNFLMLTLCGEPARNSLTDILASRKFDLMIQLISEIIYFSENSRQQVISHHSQRQQRNAVNFEREVALPRRRAMPFYQDPRAYDYNAGLAASEAQPSHRPSTPKPMFNSKQSVPDNLHLTDEVVTRLKKGKYKDPVTLEKSMITDIPEFVCVPVKDDKSENSVTFHHLYQTAILKKHIEATGIHNGKFKDINTGSQVNINDVFSMSSQLLSKKYPQEEQQPEPAKNKP